MAYNSTITGNLGRDPELRYLESGQTVANFTVAVRQAKRDAPARWVKVALWGKAAQYVGDYVRKGDSVLLIGRTEAPEVFTRRDGTTGIAEVFTAENIEKFGERTADSGAARPAAAPAPAQAAPAAVAAPAAPAPQGWAPQAAPGQVAPDADDVPF